MIRFSIAMSLFLSEHAWAEQPHYIWDQASGLEKAKKVDNLWMNVAFCIALVKKQQLLHRDLHGKAISDCWKPPLQQKHLSIYSHAPLVSLAPGLISVRLEKESVSGLRMHSTACLTKMGKFPCKNISLFEFALSIFAVLYHPWVRVIIRVMKL